MCPIEFVHLQARATPAIASPSLSVAHMWDGERTLGFSR